MSGGSSYLSPKAVSAFNVMFSYMSNRRGGIIAPRRLLTQFAGAG
jgi:hypothetical protein